MTETKSNVEERTEPDDLRLLRGLVPLEEAASLEARRPRLVSAIEREIAAGALRREARARRRRWFVVASAVAAVALLGFGVTRFVSEARAPESARGASKDAAGRAWVREARDARERVHGDGAPLVRGTTLGVGSALHTSAGGSSELALGERVRVTLSGETGIELVELSEKTHRVALRSGRVDVSVDRIERAPEQIVIETFDTRVEVIGTVFSVAVKPGVTGQLVTEVEVTRGRVAVVHAGSRRELSAGERFVSASVAKEQAGPTLPRESVETKSAASPRAEATSDGAKASPEVVLPPAEKSTLAEQNRLFERGLEARDRGDDESAVRAFRELTTKYPGSPLWSAAEEERRRAAARLTEMQRRGD